MAQGRKVVGILVTYSWSPEGQVFPVREGRNFIGRDKDCEICMPDDQTMSGRNSHITFRQNFVVGDMVSMTGTDVNGTPIEEQFHALGNYSTIRAGSTYFTFIVIKPLSGDGAADATQSEKYCELKSKPRPSRAWTGHHSNVNQMLSGILCLGSYSQIQTGCLRQK